MEFAEAWEIQSTCEHIIANGYTRVTLQFPDDMLQDAPLVADALQQDLVQRLSAAKVYVLADTSYNPLSVDEVAAVHVNADCVVHYGYASLNPVSRIPAFCVLPKAHLDVRQCSSWVAQQLTDAQGQVYSSSCGATAQHSSCAVVCCDQSYMHLLPQLREAMLLAYQGPLRLVFARSAPLELKPAGSLQTPAAASSKRASCVSSSCCGHEGQQIPHSPASDSLSNSLVSCNTSACCQQQGNTDSSVEQITQNGTGTADDSAAGSRHHRSSAPPVGGLLWELPDDSGTNMQQPLMVWLGPFSSPALTHLQLTHNTHPWLMLDPASQVAQQGLAPGLDRLLKRRYYLVERARSATMIGLLVGTLGAAGYLQALSVLRELAKQAGRKTYTLLMGKPNPAKLANFPEIEVFVMLADPQGLILDSKEYLSPIIIPHEAYLAFTDQEFNAATYRLDFEELLGLQHHHQQALPRRSSPMAHPIAAELGGNISSPAEEDGDNDPSTGTLASSLGALVVAGANSKAVALGTSSRTGQQVQVHSAAQYLTQHRTYKGLETPATGGELLAAENAVPGRSGRAAVYLDEPAA